MVPPEGRDELLSAAIETGRLASSLTVDPEAIGIVAAHRKLESLFKLLRQPAIASGETAPTMAQPAQIGRYQVTRVLGSGAFGTVYLAEDPDLNRPVAIKVPRPERLLTPRDSERLLEEARLAAALTHPGIVTIYDVDHDESWCWIVSEYVAGRTLEAVMETERFAPIRAAHLAAQIADALHYAHKKGLFHRDLKPANILIDEHGQPHIADFGLAVSEETQRQQAGQVAGTPAYMSPEQVRGETHRLDGRTDIWSLGVLLYQLLTRCHPFWKGNVHECLDEILNRDPKPPRQIDDTIPPGLERICLKALAKNPDYRYTNAGDMAEDLRAVVHRKSVFRLAALSATIGLIFAVIAIILYRWMQPDTPNQQPPTVTASGTSTLPVLEDAGAYLERGIAHGERGGSDQAIADLTEAIRLDPQLAKAYSCRGNAYADKGEFDKAIVNYTEAIRLDPSLAEAYVGRGSAYKKNGEYDKAIADCTEAIRLDPKLAEAYSRRGFAYAAKGEYDKAIGDCTEAMRLDPKLSEAYSNRGFTYMKKDECDKAIADCTDAIRLNPKNTEAYLGRGIAYGKKNDLDKAIADFTEAVTNCAGTIERDPILPMVYINRGFTYAEKGDLDTAIADYSEVIRLGLPFGMAHSRRGFAYAKKGEYDKAIADFTEAIRLDPSLAAAYAGRGTVYVKKGEYEEAIADCTEAIRLDPKYAKAYKNRGLAYAKKGDLDTAIADFTEAIRLEPRFAEAYYSRGLACEKKGEKAKAKEDFAQANRLGYKP